MTLKKYPPDYNPILEYWEAIQSGKEIVSSKIYKTYRHIVQQLTAKNGEYFYSVTRANHVLEFIENFCHHSKGKMGGRLVDLELWEKAMLATIFGFVDVEGNRQYREALLIVGKKNGKSLLASGVGNYMMAGDGEAGPEVYAVAPLALNTPIVTSDGVKTMGDISIGDFVFDPDGNAVEVDYISPIVNYDCYEIVFDDGAKITSTGNHLWTVEQLSSGGKNKPSKWKETTVQTKDIRLTYGGRRATRIRCALPLQMNEAALQIKPYTLGAWLGDGRSNRGAMCGHVDDVEIRNRIEKDGYSISYMKRYGNTTYFTVLGLRTALGENNLLDNKHIPEEYFFSSELQRRELLAGLMDTDGTCTKSGECRYVGNCKRLCYDVHRLVLTLGYKSHIHTSMDGNGKEIYIVSFKPYKQFGDVFALSRKAERQRKKVDSKAVYRTIVDVKKVDSVPCRCISVKSDRHLFCVGNELIATHNTKKDQAKIIWLEAKRMIRKSPALLKRVKPLVAELNSDFNDGIFKPLASDSDTLDGLNIHCALMDEIHQWKNGRTLYDIIADGVTAREQPLIFITSTAGVIREDIYDEKYEEAEKVINGYEDPDGYHDEHFVAFVYELDSRAEWVDESCWKKANPGLGTIKNAKTLFAKVEKAKQNPALVKNLVCKEFNIRETSSEAWLTFEQLDNRETFDLSVLRPRYGIGGADLSSTTDLTAAKVIFRVPNDKKIYVLSMYWIAEDLLETRIREDKIPYDKWYDRGLIRICPGNSVHAKYVKEWFVEVQEQFDIYLPWIGYDAWSAKYWVEDMAEYFGAGTMIPVQQGKRTLSDPMKRLGNDISSKLIIYNNNPIDKWCLANTAYEEDKNGNIQPHKTSKPTRRIDGTAALLDAFVVYQDKQAEYLNMI